MKADQELQHVIMQDLDRGSATGNGNGRGASCKNDGCHRRGTARYRAVLALFIACTTAPAAADIISLDVRAFTDGRDLLIIKGNTLQWDHRDYAAVGRITDLNGQGRNDPTIISTTLNGVPDLTNYNWYPDWPEPPPAEIRYPALSSVFTGLSPVFPGHDYGATLQAIAARDQLLIYDSPSAANGYALTLDFNDNPSGGAVWYEARVTIDTSGSGTSGGGSTGGGGSGGSTVPEPATWAMLLLGFAAIGIVGRQKHRSGAMAPGIRVVSPPFWRC